MATSAADILARLKQELVADKKKAAILGSLVLVFVVLCVVRLAPKPDAVSAAAEDILPDKAPRPAQKATPETEPLIRPEPQHIGPVAEPVTPQRKTPPRAGRPIVVVSQFSGETTTSRDIPAVSVVSMGRTLDRNLFNTPDWSPFTLERPVVMTPVEDGEGVGLSAFIGQWREAMAERREVRQRQKQAILAELGELELQSTMTGSQSLAYISGRLVRVGSDIQGFSVVAIEEKSVKLEKYGHTFELRLP